MIAGRLQTLYGLCLLLGLLGAPGAGCHHKPAAPQEAVAKGKAEEPPAWSAPDTASIAAGKAGDLIRYGRRLISSTSCYFGPKGSIARISNGMNCQNCHLDAGTRPWGNNFGAVYSTYPKFRERRGAVENIFQRISDCFERSLNGHAPDSTSLVMQAMRAYIQWVGKGVARGVKPRGSGLENLPLLSRAADTAKGRILFLNKCTSCHGMGGQGQPEPGGISYRYPPLWGPSSYNTGAGLYRISRLAAYISNNMPFGSTHASRQLSDEQAWDLAAFVNSRPRPSGHFRGDWPDISQKPFDHPFGPYVDSFPESMHKYGPFAPILQAKKDLAAAGTRRR